MGLDKDRGLLDDLNYQLVIEIADAEFILNAGYDYDGQAMEELLPTLEMASARNIPMLCINPDLEVVRLSGERLHCAGYIAQEFEQMGGTVEYIGKPHQAVYDACFKRLGDMDHTKVLAVGDTLATDIKGANAVGLDNALVTGGVLKACTEVAASYEQEVNIICDEHGVIPRFVISDIRLAHE
jgi:HAD superfamily hydrolase (TIGR01459 family)